MNQTEIKERIEELVREYYKEVHAPSKKDDVEGRVQYSGRVYDEKEMINLVYVYSHFGYNLKATDMQASVGCAQLEKLPGFVETRKKNWVYLREKLAGLSDKIIMPEKASGSEPSWFGFLMTVRKDAGFTRDDLAQFLENRNIQTRNLFSGNYIKHPCFDEMREAKEGYRVVGKLTNTDIIMNDSLWIGVYPGMNQNKLDYMISNIQEFVGKH